MPDHEAECEADMPDPIPAPKGETRKARLQERRGATSLWRLVERALEQEIRAGTWAPGNRLPTEFELAARFDVHRNTVRHALSSLRKRNLLRIEQGRGAFVKERVVRHHIGPTSRLSAAIRDIYRAGERRILGFSRVRAEEDLGRDLRLDSSHFARKVDTITVVDGLAVAVASSYFPLPRFEGIEQVIVETGSFTEAWRRYGVNTYKRYETRISAIALSKADAEWLGLPPRQPILLVTNINVDVSGTPIVVSRMRVAPRHMELVVTFE
ncbi:phosphonate metabolism transcriptional regulator PhnF [Bradyrhizobium algeriense]|uniref:phosphonate metabolism transcriptional regulator PhnF n=1 Tax=Bradyrhizobium algeriense TaxID=634784 RepID=UPI00167D890D|nr:phosphonate metabolism transcriptional regulator PhnF [Bradyrhizobium algeriense]